MTNENSDYHVKSQNAVDFRDIKELADDPLDSVGKDKPIVVIADIRLPGIVRLKVGSHRVMALDAQEPGTITR